MSISAASCPYCQYTVSTTTSVYGFVDYGNGTSPLVTLAPEARSASQLWQFERSTMYPGALHIKSPQAGRYLTYINDSDNSGPTFISTQTGPYPWWLTAVPGIRGFYYICWDVACEVAWVPATQLEGNEDDRHIRLSKQEDNLKEVQGNEWRVQLVVQPTSTNPTTIVQPTTNPSTIVQWTSTSRPSPTATTIGVGNENIMDLLRCAPCGAEKCSFERSGSTFPPETHEVVIGPPVSNCKQAKDGSNSIKSTIGGTYELGHSFSVEITAGVSAGLGFAGVSVSTTINRGVQEKTTQSHSIKIPIPAGQIGFLLANISYRVTPGVLKIGDDSVNSLSI